MWTVPVDGPAKTVHSGDGKPIGPDQRADNLICGILGLEVLRPDPEEFASAMPEPHRKGEKAYHVKAFRGSKEGMSFFFFFFFFCGLCFNSMI